MSKTLFYRSTQFSLSATAGDNKTSMTLQMFTPLINTCNIPGTVAFLQQTIPSVLRTECFNDNNFSFRKEAQATEIGHLFEHILLEQLCMLKIASGAKDAVFNGRTFWNWEKDEKGIFHIVVSVGEHDLIFLAPALEKTIHITEKLLVSALYQQTRSAKVLTPQTNPLKTSAAFL